MHAHGAKVDFSCHIGSEILKYTSALYFAINLKTFGITNLVYTFSLLTTLSLSVLCKSSTDVFYYSLVWVPCQSGFQLSELRATHELAKACLKMASALKRAAAQKTSSHLGIVSLSKIHLLICWFHLYQIYRFMIYDYMQILKYFKVLQKWRIRCHWGIIGKPWYRASRRGAFQGNMRGGIWAPPGGQPTQHCLAWQWGRIIFAHGIDFGYFLL